MRVHATNPFATILPFAPEPTADAIQEALRPGPTKHVDLPRAIPVVLFYETAIVDSEGGARFAADIYGCDIKLRQTLAARRAGPL